MENACPICASEDIFVFFEIEKVPVHIGVQWPNQETAQNCPKGDIRLALCRICGSITNIAFEPARLEYTQAYDNSLHFSPRFQDYARSLAARLTDRYNLYDKDIIEIGCGKGDFLSLLCEFGNNRGVGFDPSYESKFSDSEETKQVTFIKDFYSERYADYQADLICCRNVFEHIHNPTDFLSMLRHLIGNCLDTVVFFEVPNVLFILRDLSIWDIIYEHCSYFGAGSLAYIFTLCGFDVCDLRKTYRGQFLTIEALLGKDKSQSNIGRWNDIEEIASCVTHFADNYRSKLEKWQRNLERIESAGRRAVVWGAGAKGVSFLNMLKMKGQIEYIVDINPHKHGRYIPGTGQEIVPPEFLQDYQPDVVIMMNPIYENEIRQIARELRLTPEFSCA